MPKTSSYNIISPFVFTSINKRENLGIIFYSFKRQKNSYAVYSS